MSNNTKTVVLSFGGMSINQISKEYTPFLYSLNVENRMSTINGVKLFPEGGWFFGYPSKDFGMMFRMAYLPESSPLKSSETALSFLGYFDNILPDLIRSCLRAVIAEIFSRIYNNPSISLIKMPLRYASLFGREYKEVLRQKPNLFSFLTDRGVSYYDEFSSFSNTIFRYFIKKYNRISGDVFPSVFKELLHNKNNLFNVSLNKIDFLSHQHGSFSKKTLSYCRKIDRFCEKVSNYLASNFDEYNLLIFSDHGLTSVDNIFNLVKYLKQLPIKQGKDYDMFIDSICARFWPKTDSVKKFLIDHLNKIECGFIMQESDYTQNHLPFDKESKRKYGELIFIVRNHTLILPNYWQGRVPVKGMHSYFEEDDSNLSGFFLFDTSDKQKKILKSNADYWDIAPSIIRCLDEEIPKFMTGASIV